MEYIIVVLLMIIAIFLYNIQQFCKGIKRDLYEIINKKKWVGD